MTSRAEVVRAARAMVGTPWRHQGADAHGCNCAGLLIAIARALGLPHPDMPPHEELPDLTIIDALLAQYTRMINMDEATPGDLVRLRMKGRPQHLGVLADHPCGALSLIHGYEPHGVVEHIVDAKWRRRAVSAHRIAEDV